MARNTLSSCLLVFTLAALGGCSSQQSAKESSKPATALDKIQGRAQVMKDPGGATDAALSAGGFPVFIWQGTHRYRLFMKTPVEVVHGQQYIVEGVNAQKAIDGIGDPDQGKNGYPLQSSCERVVRMAWTGLPFDAADGKASLLRTTVKRYPARPVFLVTRIEPVTSAESGAAAAGAKKDEDDSAPGVSVAWDKQKASLIEGATVQPAPLWERAGGTVRCKVVISPEGKISELETGNQLCEAVEWSKFRYQPTIQRGHPVKVNTEVEVRFEPRT